MTPRFRTYFDYYQGPRETEPMAFDEDLPLRKVYEYEPIPKALNEEQARHILGSQGQLWGEYMPDRGTWSTWRSREQRPWPRWSGHRVDRGTTGHSWPACGSISSGSTFWT